MHVVMGATGHVGGAVARELLARGEPVTVIVRDEAKGAHLAHGGAEVAVADIHDAPALRVALRRGRRAFLLNPPADPAGDTDAAESATVRAILAALDGSGLELVAAQSTYGAHAGPPAGDLTTLHAFEEGLGAQPVPAAILRSAYLMTNGDGHLEAAREGGLPSMLPARLRLPMVDPADLGRAAADLLMGPARPSLTHAEGPEAYTPADAAAAFARALGREVRLRVAPPEGLEETFRASGFSAAAARSYARMTRATIAGPEAPAAPRRGTVTLQAHLDALVRG